MKTKRMFAIFAELALVILASCAMPPQTATSSPPLLSPPVLNGAPRSDTVAEFETILENIYTQVNPSVVAIEVVKSAAPILPTPPSSRFGIQPPTLHGLGSGFVWDIQGDIVTNNHVIDGADKITVALADGTITAAKLVGADPDSDLAVIHINVPVTLLHPVTMANSAQVKVGQLAIAIGSPFGEQNSMTTGNVSALWRSLPADNGNSPGPSYTIPDVIQTDAPINPGNSGGVLLDMRAQVIGVTFAVESPSGTSAGIGFAIPSAIVQRIVPTLVSMGHYEHPYLGVSGISLIPDLAQAIGLAEDQRGALVEQVTPGAPAALAGLHGSTRQITIDGESIDIGGDVVIAVEGQPVKNFDDLIGYLARSTQVNQKVTISILRDGKAQNIQVTLAARPVPDQSR